MSDYGCHGSVVAMGVWECCCYGSVVSLQDSLPLTEVECAFNTSVESIGDRDCKIQRVSALKGWAITGRCKEDL